MFGHGYTYTAHPVGCAVALKAIEIYRRDRIVDHVRRLAPVFSGRLERLTDYKLVGNARSRGLIGAFDLIADKKARRKFDPKLSVGAFCLNECQERGVITRAIGDTVALCPPLIITEEQLHELFDILEQAIESTHVWAQNRL